MIKNISILTLSLLLLSQIPPAFSSAYCSAPIWSGGKLLSDSQSCNQKILKGSWCQKNPSNCKTCSGIWCSESANIGTSTQTVSPVPETTKIIPTTKTTKMNKSTVSTDQSEITGSSCTGNAELDSLLERSGIAKISKISSSSVYTWDGFCRAVRMMGDIGLPLELGGTGDDGGLAVGAANIASLLAQTMWESGGEAPFSACDENNYSGKPDAACTQRYDGQRYDSLVSSTSCAVDPNMQMRAETHASWTPGPMECIPGTLTEGCCWWGRGAIQTTGPHNYAQLQRDVLSKVPQFEQVDLCTNPEAICQVDELKWLGALYYWTTVVQREASFGCSLNKYVESGFVLSASIVGGADFATGCGGSVNNGFWASTPHGNTGRLNYFNSLMEAMKSNGLTKPMTAKLETTSCGGSNNQDSNNAAAVCGLCSGRDNCYVHGWAVPCMETTQQFCRNTINAVWCGDQESDSDNNDHNKNEENESTTSSQIAATTSVKPKNEASPSSYVEPTGNCISFEPDATTGHCNTFLTAAAQRLGVSIGEIVSFEATISNAPTCIPGQDGTFVTSTGGLWGGVQYRACASMNRRNLRGRR